MANAKKVPAKNTQKKIVAKPDVKMAAAGDKLEPKAQTESVEKRSAKPTEELGSKLRSKGDIVSALQKGGQLLLTSSGLFRLLQTNGSQNRVSKRRASSMIAKGELKLAKENSEAKFYALAVPEAKEEPAVEDK